MNRHDSGHFGAESLESAAKCYKTLGFSIIPLHGARNPSQPKLPAIKWARFQHTHPTDADLQSWFANQPQAGIGIICGRISRLLVLDFDDASAASEFRHLHPDLVDTFTVRSGTRGLPHFYYRLPEGKLVTTSAYPGADLRGEGSYVVAPPTAVGDTRWLVENDVPIHPISEFELRRLMGFLAALKPQEKTSSVQNVSRQTVGASEFRHPSSEDKLIAQYRHLCPLGRNHALFKTATLARDIGLSETACCFLLAALHAQNSDTNESYQTRYAEALKTICSAYKRPRRRNSDISSTGLANITREWLLSNNLTALARVLDGLYHVGMKPDEVFTELQVCQRLAALKIGRRSVMAALQSKMGDEPVFECVVTPLNSPHQANAAEGSESLKNSCEMSRGAKRVKNARRGRPARMYRLPSPQELAQRIGLDDKGSDGVTDTDLASSRLYRQALHARLLERRPGHYVRSWLSDRLGVSRWTTRRYEKASQLVVKPSFATEPLTWTTAASLPQKTSEITYGVFIETGDGKRYPAVRELAFRLMKQGHKLTLKRQQANFYAPKTYGVGIPTPHQMAQYSDSHEAVGIPTGFVEKLSRSSSHIRPNETDNVPSDLQVGVGIPTPQPEPTFWFCPECLDFHVMVNRPEACARCGQDAWEVIDPAIWRDTQALKTWWRQRYREYERLEHNRLQQPPKDAVQLPPEALTLADRVHVEIPNLSLANARKMVQEFGHKLIEKALGVVRGRSALRSPAGFLITFLRSEKKLLSSDNKTKEAAMQPKTESAAEWVRRLAKSQYLNFISNADDILRSASTDEAAYA